MFTFFFTCPSYYMGLFHLVFVALKCTCSVGKRYIVQRRREKKVEMFLEGRSVSWIRQFLSNSDFSNKINQLFCPQTTDAYWIRLGWMSIGHTHFKNALKP